jgi:hypothetical protein
LRDRAGGGSLTEGLEQSPVAHRAGNRHQVVRNCWAVPAGSDETTGCSMSSKNAWIPARGMSFLTARDCWTPTAGTVLSSNAAARRSGATFSGRSGPTRTVDSTRDTSGG